MITQHDRCSWANDNPLLQEYHDHEWGKPQHDDQKLFELLNLEAAQAGLNWLTILKKRDGYRAAFDDFDIQKIANYDDNKRSALLHDDRIIRNRLKINAFIENARATLAIQAKYGSLDNYVWQFVKGRANSSFSYDEAWSVSQHMSKQLKKDGFRFVGPMTCLSFMQAVGMVNSHEDTCFAQRRSQT